MRKLVRLASAAFLVMLLIPWTATAQTKPRARALGIPFDGTPGPLDAITDVKGVEVGHTTLISGSGKLVVGQGPVRTGVTAILPRGKASSDPVFAGWFSLNGNGEMTGTTWVEESGFLESPVMITNTHSVGVVRDAVIAWRVAHGQPEGSEYWWSLPVVAETYDGYLNDVNGFHVHQEDAFHAIDTAQSGPVPEGGVGGGTGMISTSSRVASAPLPGSSTRSPAATRSASSYSATAAAGSNCASRASRSDARFPRIRSGPTRRARARKTPARSSSWSRPTRLFCRIS